MARPIKGESARSERIIMRSTPEFKNEIQQRCTELGFKSMSEYIEYAVKKEIEGK